MTQIDFYTRVPNKLRTACSLCAKAFAHGQRMWVLTPDEATSAELEHALWSQPPTGFIPHVRARHRLAASTPIVIDHDTRNLDRDQLLLNLCEGTPECFSRFERLLEIVSLDEADVQAGRTRYRFYRDRGYDIRSHDLSRHAAT